MTLFFLIGFVSAHLHINQTPLVEGKNIEGIFQINKISRSTSFFAKNQLLCQGKILSLNILEEKLSYPYSFYFSKYRYPKTSKIKFYGSASKKNDFIKIKLDKKKYFEEIPQIFNLAQIRFKSKEWVRKKFYKQMGNSEEADLNIGLITGEIDNNLLKYYFHRLGLQHIIAISGFHFSIILLALSTLFKKLPFPIFSQIFLIILLTCFYLFLGNSPSILRAYITSMTYLISNLFMKKTNSLNTLGLALIIETCFYPHYIQNIGFQFTFICTFALIYGYPVIREIFQKIKKGNFFFRFLKEALLISLCINVFTIPISLYYFHKFPLISILYNLFIPSLIIIPMTLSLISIATLFSFPFIGRINHYLTKAILFLIYNPPIHLEWHLRFSNIHKSMLLLYLTLLTLSILYKKNENPLIKEIFI
ncbi:MAG TPA: ComEC/Rec2 family competence protein [Chlamydiales bacterium]|nr:ComEC/Rec2 family competence protein [Chlamydiales bacterium]